MSLFQRFFGPPTLDQFAKLIIKALRKAGDTRVPRYDKAEGRLLFTADGKEAGMMNLRNLFGEYSSLEKSERAAWMRRTMAGLINQMEIPEDFEDVKPDLFPTVRPKSMIEVMRLDAEVRGAKSFDMVALPLSEHLVICLVYDLPNSMRFVTEDDLTNWNVSPYEALEIARQNLTEKQFSIAGLGEKLYVFTNGDAYDATRMLLVDAIRTLKIEGAPVALPITRDLLLIAGADDEEGLKMMLDFAEQQKESPRPICPVPHSLVDDEWETWTLPADSPHRERFRRLELEYLHGEYAEQKRLMELRNEQTETDVFVASFTAIEKEDKLLSYSVWSETVPTWLPKTQYVAFLSEGQEPLGLVPWERVERTMHKAMQPLDCYPPRWFVDSFPDAAQFAELKPENLPE